MTEETIQFKVSAKIAKLLGEQSVSNSIVAISELVKNGYDADGAKVTISFVEDEEKKLKIIIEDNGHGMTFDDLEQKWMVVGTSDKEINPRSPQGRRKVGEKGIGRFAVQRLGDKLRLISKPKSNDDLITLDVNWLDYLDPDKKFNEIDNTLSREKRDDIEQVGVTLIISELRDKWTKKEIENLQKQLGVIVPPMWSEKKFSVIIKAPHVGLQKSQVISSLLENAAYQMVSNYNPDDKKISYTIFLSNDEHAHGKIIVGKLSCGPISFKLYYYPLGPSSKYKKMRPLVLKDSLLRKQLDENHGILQPIVRVDR